MAKCLVIVFFLFLYWFPISLVLMCVVCLGCCPIFQKMIIKYLVPGTNLVVGAPFSKNWSSGIGIGYQFGVVVSTPLGTRKVELVPSGLVSPPPPLLCNLASIPLACFLLDWFM